MHSFVGNPPGARLPRHRAQQGSRFACPTHPSRVTCAASPRSPRPAVREPWPAGRFLRDLLFFRPVFKPPRPDLGKEVRRQQLSDRPVVFVTGATGGVGKRVVAQLQDAGFPVRCLVRNLERARDVLKEAGVDFSSSSATVELIAGDLYNLHPDMVKRVGAVVSATGVKIGPVDDDIDRRKYYQGITFYEPVILEDTPENVEYVGIRNLVDLFKDQLNAPKTNFLPITTFQTAPQVEQLWGVVDDIVMGGVSESGIRFEEPGRASFRGNVSSKNSGGFASVRTAPLDTPLVLSNYTGFRLRVRGDGQRYKFIARCDDNWDGVAYCCSIDTIASEWVTVDIPFEKLKPVFRGRTTERGLPFNPGHVTAFQLMLSKFEYDGELNSSYRDGPFCLDIASIGAYRESSAEILGPDFIHVSSAGVTRPLRRSEFPDLEKQPPAVRMNEMLGRVLEWKLAGEDKIREQINRYIILRPCALTEEPPSGVDRLVVSTGDKITGKVSRDDIATLIVKLLRNDSIDKATVEIATGADQCDPEMEISSQEEGDPRSRLYAKFPFVPEQTQQS